MQLGRRIGRVSGASFRRLSRKDGVVVWAGGVECSILDIGSEDKYS
jgi:hypothetical protein